MKWQNGLLCKDKLMNYKEIHKKKKSTSFKTDIYLFALFICVSVDAAVEDNSLGRLVNDDHVSPNSKMKTITVAGKPHLCLFATRSISPGEEITYNYGDSEWPWRCKVFQEEQLL